jgi:hypothetical protein
VDCTITLVRTALKIVAALLFVLVTPRAAMGEIFEVVGTGAETPHVASATLAELDGESGPDLGEGDGPTKPRWAIPKRRQLGRLQGTGLSMPSAGSESPEQANPLLVPTGAGGAELKPNRH